MIKQSFDFARNWEYVRYVRMSSDLQNPRSLDQQFEAIDAAVKRRGLTHWRCVGDYPDDAQSGRYVWRRPQFKKMIADMTSGRCRAKVIIVHSTDRLGRTEQLTAIRAKLFREHGIVVLTVDSGLEDPLSVSGQAFAFVETLRSTGENRARAEKVLLGKMDLVSQGYWGGGPPPLGFELEEATDVVAYRGRNRRRPSKLKVDLRTSPIVVRIFELAHQGVGQDGIAVLLNEDQDVPADLKPFHGATIGRILDNPIYSGTLRWNYRCTDVLYD
ncbi:MAG TPA: recombinase family protein, partial [Pirellulales bacterium]